MTNIYNEIIISEIKSCYLSLGAVIDNGYRSYTTESLVLDELEDFCSNDIRQSVMYKKLFDRLLRITGPVVYWFELDESCNKKNIIEKLLWYKDHINERSTPALNKSINYSSNILYVGKVKNKFYGRLIQHLGYFTNSQTQGLQLYHWLSDEGIKLTVHIFEFDENMADLIGVVENRLARKLQPLIGKHK